MKKFYALASLLALAVFVSIAYAQGGAQNTGNAAVVTGGAAVGQVVKDFTLPDADGTPRTLASLKGAKGTVLIFISTRCPVSNGYNERMAKLTQDYQARGVRVVGINANSTEPADEVKQHAASHNLSFTILKDAGNKVADYFNAKVTPEAFLIDAGGKLVYRGRIDNADPRRNQPVTSEDLRNALDEVLAGKAVSKAEGLAFGCTIKRAAKTD
ncbi:MAG TPA: thioredoxin family protein [Pyrinomonadaceae bacterium]